MVSPCTETRVALVAPHSGEKWGRRGWLDSRGAAGEGVGPSDMRQWDAHMVHHSSDLRGMAATPTGRPGSAAAGRRLTGGPARYAQYLFLFIQMLSNRFEL
jgi:hypothetical protein